MKTKRVTRLLLGAVAATAMMGVATTASAMSFKVSGQVDRAIIAADNGESSDVGFVDNSGSNTRFRFTGDQAFDNGYHVGFKYEIGLGTNSSYGWDINQNTTHGDYLDSRHADLYVSGNFGKLSLGKGSPAGDGTSETDFSGTAFLGGGIDFIDSGGGISFVSDAASPAAVTKVGKVFSEFDVGRANRLRYDTQSMGGAVLSASVSEGGAYSVAARFGSKMDDGTKVGVAVSYEDSMNNGDLMDPVGNSTAGTPYFDATTGTTKFTKDGARYQTYGGSAAVLLPSGINFAATYKQRKDVYAAAGNEDTASTAFFGVGYRTGQHNVQVNWGETKDMVATGSKADQIGLAYVYDWTSSVQLYASYHNYQLDLDGSANDLQDINMVFIGSRIKFL